MKVIIAGSRNITSMKELLIAIDNSKFDITTVISGGAKGVDTLGENWAENKCIPVEKFPANWAVHGNSAGYLRNEVMASKGDALIALWDGQSKGTKHMIDLAKKYNLEVYIHYAEPSAQPKFIKLSEKEETNLQNWIENETK